MLDFDALAELNGLIGRDVGETLHNFAACVPADQSIIELGSYRGKSTCYLATGAATGNGAFVYAVDAWSIEVSAWRSSVLDRLPSPEYRDFLNQLQKADVEDRVTPIRSLTTLAGEHFTGEMVGLLYIDGDHHKGAVLSDFRAWRRHLTDDAVVIFDDYAVTSNPGVSAAVAELAETGEIVNVEQKATERIAIANPGKVIGERVPGVRK